MQGLGLGVLENCYPYYPSVEHRGAQFGSYLAPGMEDLPQIDTIIIENPSTDGPYGAKGIGEMANNAQPPAIASAVYDAVGVWVTELPDHAGAGAARPPGEGGGGGEPRRDGKTVVFDEELSVNTVGSGITFGPPPDGGLALPDVHRRGALPIFPGVGLHAVAGDQVFLGRVTYEPGTTVKRHTHEHTEQAMLVLEGSVTMTIGDETREMGPGDVCVVNRGVEHELASEGVTFIEALAPVPLDHIGDRERDLVLGDLNGSLHVER